MIVKRSHTRKLIVFSSIGTGLLFLFFSLLFHVPKEVFGQETAAPQEEEAPSTEFFEVLPEIEANSFEISVAKRSKSLRVYLFNDPTDARPGVGSILLLKREGQPKMAFRVIKHYPEKNQIAARWVRKYEGVTALDEGEVFLGVEKVRDVFTEDTGTLKRDNVDLKELEASLAEYDPELDATTTPPEKQQGEVAESEDLPDDPLYSEIMADEIRPIDVDHHWVGAEVGFLRNNGSEGGSVYFSGAGVRYGLTTGKMVFMRRPDIQDSFVMDLAFNYYQVLNFSGTDDTYTIAPVTFSLRYNIMFGLDFALFGYLGLTKNFVLDSSQATDNGKAALASTLPAGGVGLMFRIGPKWHFRADLGIDRIASGLVLRF